MRILLLGCIVLLLGHGVTSIFHDLLERKVKFIQNLFDGKWKRDPNPNGSQNPSYTPGYIYVPTCQNYQNNQEGFGCHYQWPNYKDQDLSPAFVVPFNQPKPPGIVPQYVMNCQETPSNCYYYTNNNQNVPPKIQPTYGVPYYYNHNQHSTNNGHIKPHRVLRPPNTNSNSGSSPSTVILTPPFGVNNGGSSGTVQPPATSYGVPINSITTNHQEPLGYQLPIHEASDFHKSPYFYTKPGGTSTVLGGESTIHHNSHRNHEQNIKLVFTQPHLSDEKTVVYLLVKDHGTANDQHQPEVYFIRYTDRKHAEDLLNTLRNDWQIKKYDMNSLPPHYLRSAGPTSNYPVQTTILKKSDVNVEKNYNYMVQQGGHQKTVYSSTNTKTVS